MEFHILSSYCRYHTVPSQDYKPNLAHAGFDTHLCWMLKWVLGPTMWLS